MFGMLSSATELHVDLLGAVATLFDRVAVAGDLLDLDARIELDRQGDVVAAALVGPEVLDFGHLPRDCPPCRARPPPRRR